MNAVADDDCNDAGLPRCVYENVYRETLQWMILKKWKKGDKEYI